MNESMSDSVLKLSQAQASSSHSQRPPVHPSPAPGSIRAILLENFTTRLFIHPFEWTADHFHALDVELVTSVSLREPVAEDIKSQVVESRIIRGALKDINGCELVRRDKAIRGLIISMGKIQKLQMEWKRLHLMYENQTIVKLHYVLIAQPQSTSEIDSRLPIWAYTDHNSTSTTRWQWYNSKKKSRSFALKEIKHKAELLIDPVYIAILIALAQRRRRFIPQGPTLHRVTLFAPIHESIVIARQEIVSKIVQYTADVSTVYLQKFEEPYKFYDASLHIEKKILSINETAAFFQAMKSASNDLNTSSKSSFEESTSKREALEELHLNTDDQKLESKRRKVCDT